MMVTACQSSLTNELYNYGEEFELAFGEEVNVGLERIEIEFLDVLEDSRCPSNVTCVWAGNGEVEIRFSDEKIRLNTYLEPHVAAISNVDIQLISLNPYPEHPRQFKKEDYVIRLLITKR